LKSRVHAAVQIRELMLEGVLGIAEGLNPKLIRMKLEAYAPPAAPKKAPKEAPARAGAGRPAEAVAGE
jgi:chemotaxis protein MotA